MTAPGSPYNTNRYKLARAAFIANAAPICRWEHCPVPGRFVDKRLSGRDKWGPSLDHRIPTSFGGDFWDVSQWQLTHTYCNSKKNTREELPRPTRTDLTW